METRVALIAIIVEKGASVQGINDLLHEHADRIIGRSMMPTIHMSTKIITAKPNVPKTVKPKSVNPTRTAKDIRPFRI